MDSIGFHNGFDHMKRSLLQNQMSAKQQMLPESAPLLGLTLLEELAGACVACCACGRCDSRREALNDNGGVVLRKHSSAPGRCLLVEVDLRQSWTWMSSLLLIFTRSALVVSYLSGASVLACVLLAIQRFRTVLSCSRPRLVPFS
ncbi:hypothetical protein L596_003024 [Steinernema carpocapsae]|uniref:Uncharacterized protein n=1 Tax=Steinernema carpocapsae TaxID=34508 RepID=A0A4U8USV5_STECR|nr:hypothetical protein L596_003024 [Steinernema carpocapsae]